MITHMKRTTLMLEDSLMVDLKKLAADRQRTMSSIVDEFLRQGLSKAQSQSKTPSSPTLPTFRMGRPRANLADRDQLGRLMDDI